MNPKDVDGGIAQLRLSIKRNTMRKPLKPRPRRKPKRRPRRKPRLDGSFPRSMPALSQLRKQSWGILHLVPVDDLPLMADDASDGMKCLRSLQEQGLLEPLQDCTPYLQSHVASRLVSARMSGEDSLQVPESLQYAIDNRHPQLAEEAFKALDGLRPAAKAGAAPRKLKRSLAAPSGIRRLLGGANCSSSKAHFVAFKGSPFLTSKTSCLCLLQLGFQSASKSRPVSVSACMLRLPSRTHDLSRAASEF